MPRVIDRFMYSKRLSDRYPDLARFGDGLMVILDPQEVGDLRDLAGQVARVERPDGSSETLPIHHSEVRHGVVGLFFQGIDESRIPRLSVVTWDAIQ